MDNPTQPMTAAVGDMTGDAALLTNPDPHTAKRRMFPWLLIVSLVLMISFSLLALFQPDSPVLVVLASPVIVLVVAMVGLSAMHATLARRPAHLFERAHAAMQSLANAMGMAYAPVGDPASLASRFLKPASVPLTDLKLFDVVSGTYAAKPVRIFIHEQHVVESRNQVWRHTTVIEFTLPIAVPDMLLNSAYAASTPAYGAALKPAGYVRVGLEGEFGIHFGLYVPQGAEVTALEVFEPSVMSMLMEDAYKTWEVEFAGAYLYLCPVKLITDPEELKTTLEAAERLYDRFRDTLETMA